MVSAVQKCFLVCVILGAIMAVASGFGDLIMLGSGIWSVQNVRKCDEDDRYLYKLVVERKRINRTHDAFDGYFEIPEVLTLERAIRIDACKYVDGGCKPFQRLEDKSFCEFAKKWAGNNFDDLLTSMGVDPPTCPIAVGNYEFKDFMFDYEGLPDHGVYGQYEALLYLVDDSVDVACISLSVNFKERE